MAKGDIALDNKTRRIIYNHIYAYPGVSFNTLKEIFELSPGALRYHLNYLEKYEKISCGLEKGNRCYYPFHNGFNISKISQDRSGLHKLTPHQKRVLNTIKRYPGINQKELINRTKMNRSQISKNLQKLVNLNIVQRNKIGKQIYYEYVPDDELKFMILKRLVIKLLRDEIDEQTFLKLKRKLE